jgi:hypothetical protein
VCQRQQAVLDPTTAMVEVIPAERVFATEKSAPHTTGNAVIVGSGAQADQRSTGLGHGVFLFPLGTWIFLF